MIAGEVGARRRKAGSSVRRTRVHASRRPRRSSPRPPRRQGDRPPPAAGSPRAARRCGRGRREENGLRNGAACVRPHEKVRPARPEASHEGPGRHPARCPEEDGQSAWQRPARTPVLRSSGTLPGPMAFGYARRCDGGFPVPAMRLLSLPGTPSGIRPRTARSRTDPPNRAWREPTHRSDSFNRCP